MQRIRMATGLVAVLVGLALAATPAAGQGPAALCPDQEDACVDRLLADMERNVARLDCRHLAPFALLYWRTTESMRDAIRAGEFADRGLWNQVTTAFGRYYLNPLAAWRRGDTRRVPRAWRIAFRAAGRERVVTLGDVMLGINAHVNHDLAFMYHRFGLTDRAGHLHVNTVLARVAPIAYPEIAARLDPTVTGQAPDDPGLSLDILAWRERAWKNARRLDAARSSRARRAIAADIERHSAAMARRIRAAFPATREENARRLAACREAQAP